MTTGHPNAGYDQIVSRFKLALDNPSGNRTITKTNKDELQEIMAKSKEIWAAKDTSETTYGNTFRNYNLKEKLFIRPSSVTRKNNPHPAKVFMSSHMKDLPGYFDDNPEHLNSYPSNNFNDYQQGSQMSFKQPALLYQNSNSYLDNLAPSEANQMEATFNKAGIDTTKKSNSISHDEPIIYSSDSITKFASQKPKITLQSNLTNPYLYNDLREYREKYAINDHGMPNPDKKRPSRGDFMIHPDWHARLKHHRLPCDC